MYNEPGPDMERDYLAGAGDTHFLQMLFDYSFSEFVTVALVRVLYALSTILGVIAAVFIVFRLFSMGLLAGLFSILLAPMGFLIWMVASRVLLEMVVVIYRIAEYLRDIAEAE